MLSSTEFKKGKSSAWKRIKKVFSPKKNSNKGVDSEKGTPGTYTALDCSAESLSYNNASEVPLLDQVQTLAAESKQEIPPKSNDSSSQFNFDCKYENVNKSLEGLNAITDTIEVQNNTNTPKLNSDSEPDGGIGLHKLSVTNTSSEESLNSTLSSVEKNNDPQKEETENQVQLGQAVKEESKMQGSGDSGSHAKDPIQPEEKKKEAISNEQSAPDNNNNDVLSKKQPNNRNLHVVFAAGCALLAVGCLVTAAIAKSGILCVIGAVFAIAAVTTWCLTPSSELTSTDLSPLVDDKELTAYSQR